MSGIYYLDLRSLPVEKHYVIHFHQILHHSLCFRDVCMERTKTLRQLETGKQEIETLYTDMEKGKSNFKESLEIVMHLLTLFASKDFYLVHFLVVLEDTGQVYIP